MKISTYMQFLREKLEPKNALILTGEGFQDQELLQPKSSLEKNNVTVKVAGIKVGKVKAYNNDTVIEIQHKVEDLNPDNFDILILPGGKAPQNIRQNKSLIKFVKEFAATGKPIAAICHGPLILVSANLVNGVKMTCFEDAKKELIDAGADYIDESCVIDKQFITSRNPKDLDIFCKNILQSI